MKKITLLFLLLATTVFSQVRLLSWNIENLGKSKSEEALAFMVATMKNHDIVAIQEVVAGYGGAQTVAKLADLLNRTGNKWDYVVSNPTSSSAYKTERYAFLWKTATVKKVGKPWLEQKYHQEIDREPFFCTFDYQGKQVTIVNFHAITKNRQPETEIKYFKFFPETYPKLNLLFAGDFNCPQSHSVFNPWRKMGYVPILINQKTSLRKKCDNGDCLASEFDNIWYHSQKIKAITTQIIPFHQSFPNITEARKISDHVPVSFTFTLL